jgi:ABC-type cobalamin/Fe3+-siderophores transport system ATPase subunit
VPEITGLARSYDQHPVISDQTVDVPRGGHAALTGPSGCGKPTLIRCILGLLRPDCGLPARMTATRAGTVAATDHDIHLPTINPKLRSI